MPDHADLTPEPPPQPAAETAETTAAAERVPAAAAPAAPLAFEAELEHDGETGGVFVVVPPAVTAALGLSNGAGAPAKLAVLATFDGFPHSGLLTPLPGGAEGEFVLLVPKQVRKAIAKTWTNDVAVTLAPDPAAQALALPADLRAALAAVRGSRARFQQLSKAHQREYIAWIEAAKTAEGRAERVTQTAERMMIGVKRR